MANARAIANGNWSSTSTWNGGVLPGNGDTVYSNGFNVTIDQNITIGGANNPTVNTGSLVSGQWYEIVNVGGQNWTSIGASSNTVGTVFQATGAGTAGNLGTAKATATLTTATNTAAGATTGGGGFTMATVYSCNADLRAGTTTCLNVTATTGTATFSGIRIIGGTATGAYGFNNNSTATVEFNGVNCVSGNTTNAHAVNLGGSGTLNITGSASTIAGGVVGIGPSHGINNAGNGTINVTATGTIFTGGSGSGTSSGIVNNSASGNINISASCIFNGGNSTANISAGLLNSQNGTITISASSTFNAGTGAQSPALSNGSNGTVTVTNSTFTASAFSPAVSGPNSGANVSLSGSFFDHWQGYSAIYVAKWKLGTTPAAAQHRMPLAGTTDSYVTFYTADNGIFGNPAASNVRAGIIYGGGNLTGSCEVPSAGSVALGVPIDNTIGTAILTQANVQSALTAQGLTTTRAGYLDRLDATISSRSTATTSSIADAVWTAVTRTLTEGGGISAEDVWTYATREITGGTVDTLVNAPDVPTAADIATEVWDTQTSTLTTSGAIGTRLKNSSTVATTGSQLAAALS